MTGEVLDNPSQQRFELEAQGRTAFIAYRRRGDIFSLDHTEVPKEMSGGGVGSALVKGALDLVRKQGGKVIVRCSFVAAYIERHAEYRTLLSE